MMLGSECPVEYKSPAVMPCLVSPWCSLNQTEVKKEFGS